MRAASTGDGGGGGGGGSPIRAPMARNAHPVVSDVCLDLLSLGTNHELLSDRLGGQIVVPVSLPLSGSPLVWVGPVETVHNIDQGAWLGGLGGLNPGGGRTLASTL